MKLCGELLDLLNTQYEKGGGYLGEIGEKVDNANERMKTLNDSVKSQYDELDTLQTGGFEAVSMLEALSAKSELTNSDLKLMGTYADYLNDTFNCNIVVDYDTGKLTGFNPKLISDQIMESYKNQKVQIAIEAVSDPDFVDSYTDLYDTRIMAQEEYNDTLDKYKDEAETLYSEYLSLSDAYAEGDGDISSMLDARSAYRNVQDKIDSAKEELDKANDAFEEAYDEAYTSIRTSLDGMFGLFESAEMNLSESLSMDSAISNLESQMEYFDQYEEALSKLSNMGIDNNIISQLDPSQAVAFAQELSQMDSEAAAAKIDEINGAFNKLSDSKNKIAETMTNIDAELNERFDDIRDNMEEAIDGMNLEGIAKVAAKSTMDGYINQLKRSGDSAVLTAENISARISSALNLLPSFTSPAGSAVAGAVGMIGSAYAGGTLSAEPGLALVGEKGPELVMFGGGEAVYTADETAKIINGYADSSFNISPLESPVKKYESKTESVSRREVNLNINGRGTVSVKGGMSKEQILELLQDHLKPILVNIVNTEIFEEGESSYET